MKKRLAEAFGLFIIVVAGSVILKRSEERRVGKECL